MSGGTFCIPHHSAWILYYTGYVTATLRVDFSCRRVTFQATFCASKLAFVVDSGLVIHFTFMKMKQAESCASLRSESLVETGTSRWSTLKMAKELGRSSMGGTTFVGNIDCMRRASCPV